MDSAPSELVNDIQREFFSYKSTPADVQQGNNLREQVVRAQGSSDGIFNKKIVELL